MTFEEGMNSMSSVPSSRRVLTALFDTREDAREAVDAVVAAGVASSDIKVVEGGSSYQASADVRPYQEEGFWQSLMNLFMPEDDRYTYAEGLRRGGYVVTVECDDANYEVVSEILDREGTVDLDARAEEWRSTGWTGPETSLSGAHPDITTASTAVANEPLRSKDIGDTSRAPKYASDKSDDIGSSANQTIPIGEERLNVGKRDVNQGRVRVRSYVVESPVQEEVTLRNESVTIERRPADRSASGTADPFQERTIELEQHGEEAVISKEARITGEVVVNKDETFRTQKVQDTVRRTEVEIEDERTAKDRPDVANPTVKRGGGV